MFNAKPRWQHQPYGDVEMNPIGHGRTETDHSWRRLINVPTDPNEQLRRRKCQHILQDGHPTFVPTLSLLREECLKRTRNQLRELEKQIERVANGPEKDLLVDEAIILLRDLDRQFDAIADRHQLEDPEYAAQRGLSLTHFTLSSGENQGDWMLLSSNWGPNSTSITESDLSQLSSVKKDWLATFAGGKIPPIVAFKRQKSTLERQRGAVQEDGNVLVPNPRMIKIWATLLGLGFTALMCFLGVGIIATTTTFSPIFVQYFFWIAILWTMASSSLLVLLVRAFGANGRDCMSAFLAGVAIWLVVIQIGQTKLNGQLGVN